MILRSISLLFLVFAATQAKSQYLYFNLNDESVQMYTISEVRRMDFDSSSINLHLIDESVVSFELDALNNYRYTPGGITAIDQLANHPQLNFFPNPADQQLNLRYFLPNPSSAVQVRIHNLKGEKFIHQEMKSSTQGELTVDLSKLAAGQYFCTLTSGEVVISKAFMKK
jgi:hypothetical protein